MKITLINPVSKKKGAVSVGIPTGLYALGSFLSSKNHIIQFIDAPIEEFSQEDIIKETLLFKPEVIGFGPMTSQFKSAILLCNELKNIIPETHFIMGGSHASFERVNILKEFSNIDYIISGEAEIPILNLLNYFSGKEELKENYGISFRKDAEIHDGGIAEPYNLSNYPFFNTSLLPLSLYSKKDKGEFGPTFSAVRIMTGRGCTSNCKFCIVHKINPGKPRNYPIENIKKQLSDIKKAGIRYIKFADDTFCANREYAISIAEMMIKENFDLKFEIETRLDTLDDKLLRLLKKAGLEGVWFGIESSNEIIRNNMVKQLDTETLVSKIKLLHDHDIRSSAFFMTALPGQTEESILKDAEYATSLDLDLAVFSILTPFPGTYLRNNLDDFKIKIIDNDYDNWTEMISVIETEELDANQIEIITKSAYKNFFTNPDYLKRNTEFRTRMKSFVVNVILA